MVKSSPPPSSPSSRNDIPNPVRDVLNLCFPRCSCCQTGWYDAVTGEEGNGLDGSNDMTKPATGKRKRRRDRSSHFDLLPMPKCSCATRLAAPGLPSGIFASDDCKDPLQVLSQIQIQSFPNLAICKSCLTKRIAASKEVTVHDYRMEHIPNGQRNVKFTVEADCVQCKRKFMGRALEKLLDSGGGPKNTDGNVNSRKKKGNPEANWWDALDATIQLVGWAKRENRRERRRIHANKRAEKINPSRDGDRTEDRNEYFWQSNYDFTGGEGECSSDECYSLSSDSCDEWQSDDEPRPVKGPHRVKLKSGELMEELLQKDPKFRQEREDEQYVKKVIEEEEENKIRQKQEDEKYAQKFVEQEEKKNRLAQMRARQDHEMAMKLQEEFDSKGKKSKVELKSPILDAWKKASTKETDGKQSPAVCKAPRKNHATPLVLDGRSTTSRPPSSAKQRRREVSSASSQTPVPKTKSADTTDLKSQSTSKVTKLAIHEVVAAMGCSEALAWRFLNNANGDANLAVSMLLSEEANR